MMFFLTSTADAAVVTWDGGGADNNWSTALNWDTDSVPTSNDVATFDGTSTKDVTVDAISTVGGVDINSGYTGIITLSNELNVDDSGTEAGNFAMDTATLSSANSQSVNVDGSFTMNGGTFSAEFHVYGDYVQGGGSVTIKDSSYNEGNFTLNGGSFIMDTGNASDGWYPEKNIYIASAATFTQTVGEIYWYIAGGGTYSLDTESNAQTFSSFGFYGCGATCTMQIAADEVLTTTTLLSFDMSGPGTQTFSLGSGVSMIAQGDVDTGNWGEVNNLTDITLTGTSDQYLRIVGNDVNFTINKPSGGTVTLYNANQSVPGDITLTAGTFDFDQTRTTTFGGMFTQNGGTVTNSVNTPTIVFQGGLTRTAGTWTSNNEIVQFTGTGETVDLNTSVSFNTVTVNMTGDTDTLTISSGDSIITTGTLTFTNGKVNTGTFDARSHVTYSSTFDGGDGAILFSGTADQTFTPPAWDDQPVYLDVTVNKSSGTVTIANDFWFMSDFTMTAGTFDCSVNQYGFDTDDNGYTGSAGTYVQNGGIVDCSSGWTWFTSTFTLNGGTFIAPQSATTWDNLEFGRATNGTDAVINIGANATFTHSSGMAKFRTGDISYTAAQSVVFYDVVFDDAIGSGSGATTDLNSSTLRVDNTLKFKDGSVNNGTFDVRSNVYVERGESHSSGATWDGGNAVINFGGTVDQYFGIQNGDLYDGNIVINKSSGVVYMSSNLDLDAAGQDLSITSGTLSMNGNALVVADTFSNNGTLQLLGTESLSFTNDTDSGTVEIIGNGDSNNDSYLIPNLTYNDLTINMTDAGDTVSYASSNTLDDSLLAYWELDESSIGGASSIIDSSGNGYHATPVNFGAPEGPSADVPAAISSFSDYSWAFEGDNNTDYMSTSLNLDQSASSAGATFSVWLKPFTLFATNILTTDDADSSYAWGINSDGSGSVVLNTGQASGSVQLVAYDVMSANTWINITAVFSPNGATRLYADGTEVGLSSGHGATANDGNIYIGAPYTFLSGLWDGSMDDIRIYNRQLSAAEIASLAAGNSSNDPSSTVSSITVNGDLNLSSGTFSAPATLSVGGNFNNSGGTFTPNSGTVSFTDAAQTTTVSGSNTFYNLSSDLASKAITFTAGTTTSVTNSLTLRGTADNLMTLRSSSTGNAWDLNLSSSQDVQYVDVKDSDASGGTQIVAKYGSTDSGNNTNWDFQYEPTVASITASQASDDSGDVTVSFIMDDADDDDTLQAKIEYSVDGGSNWYDPTLSTSAGDTSATYGTPAIDNAQTYQVGQAAGYITSSSGSNTVSVVWKSDTDLNDTDVTNAKIRVTPYDGGAAGTAGTSSNFILDLAAPTGLDNFGPTEASLDYVKLSWTSATDSNFNHYEIWYSADIDAVRNRTVAAAEWDNDDVSFLTQATANSTKIYANPNDKYFKIYAVDDYGNASTVTETFVTVSASGSIIRSVSSGGTKTSVAEVEDKCDLCEELEDTYTKQIINEISDYVNVDAIDILVDEISEDTLNDAIDYFDNNGVEDFVHSLLENITLLTDGKGEKLLSNMNRVWAATNEVDLNGVERDSRVDLLMNRIVDFQRNVISEPILEKNIIEDIEDYWKHVSETLAGDEMTLDQMFDLVDATMALEDAIELSKYKNNFALKDVPGPFDKGFEDLWYAEAVFAGLGEKWNGYVDANGLPTYKFGPENTTLRAEALKIILLAFGYEEGESGLNWWSGWQSTAKELNLSIADLDLSKEVSRGEVFRMIYELGEMMGPDVCGNVFADLSEEEDCQPAVRLKQMGIITGDDATGLVRLYDSLNRAEMAVLSVRVDDWLELNPDLFAVEKCWYERLRENISNLFASLTKTFVSVLDVYQFKSNK